MRRLIVLVLALGSMALADRALAVTSDLIGVSLVEYTYGNCGDPTQYSVMNVYLLAVVAEPSGISGWECSLVTDPTTFVAGVTVELANGGVNALTAPDYDVTLPAAVPQAPIITLATWSTFYLGGAIKFGVGPAHPGHFASDPGPGYVAGDDPAQRIRLHPICETSPAPQSDTYYVALFGMGCPVIKDKWPCITPVETTTWGMIKELYR